jgi:hypothetical protein
MMPRPISAHYRTSGNINMLEKVRRQLRGSFPMKLHVAGSQSTLSSAADHRRRLTETATGISEGLVAQEVIVLSTKDAGYDIASRLRSRILSKLIYRIRHEFDPSPI